MGNSVFTKFILLASISVLTLPAFAGGSKHQKAPDLCVSDILTDKLGPQQMEILKAFESLLGGPVAPSQWKSGDTAFSLQAEPGKIQLTLTAMVPEKCVRLSPPGGLVDVVQKFDDYINAGIKAGGRTYGVKLCRDDGGLYIDPSYYGIRMNVSAGQSPSSIALDLVLPARLSCKDEVTKVTPATN